MTTAHCLIGCTFRSKPAPASSAAHATHAWPPKMGADSAQKANRIGALGPVLPDCCSSGSIDITCSGNQERPSYQLHQMSNVLQGQKCAAEAADTHMDERCSRHCGIDDLEDTAWKVLFDDRGLHTETYSCCWTACLDHTACVTISHSCEHDEAGEGAKMHVLRFVSQPTCRA